MLSELATHIVIIVKKLSHYMLTVSVKCYNRVCSNANKNHLVVTLNLRTNLALKFSWACTYVTIYYGMVIQSS